MRVALPDGTRLWFDVDGPVLVPDGIEMRQRPTVVLVHGGPGADHSIFKPHFSRLALHAQVVYLDLRGNGRSDASTAAHWNLARWAADLREFCDVVGIEHPVVIGDSFGTFVALAYAVAYPEHPAGLVLSSAAARIRPERGAAVFERRGGPIARRAAEEFWANPSPANRLEFTRRCLPLYQLRHEAFADSVLRQIRRPAVSTHFFEGERATFDLLSELDRVVCPVLVMNGEEDPITTIEDAVDLVAALPGDLVRLERFPGCGHGLFEEDPERAFALVEAFLSALSAS